MVRDPRTLSVVKCTISDKEELKLAVDYFRAGALCEYVDEKNLGNLFFSYDMLETGKVYVAMEKDLSDVGALRLEMASLVKARADFVSGAQLTKLCGQKLALVRNDFKLIDTDGKTELGDLRSVFKSSDSSIVCVVERKTAINKDSETNIFQQIVNTAMAFRKKLADKAFRDKLGITDPNPTVYFAIYCQAGDQEVLQWFVSQGIPVFADCVSFESPPDGLAGLKRWRKRRERG